MVVTVRRKLWLPDHVIAPTLDGPFPSHKIVVFAHCELIHCYWIFSLTAHGLFQLDRPIDPSSISASLAYSLAELVRLYGGTGSKSLRFVSTRNAFFGNTLCLSNFRESVNGRVLATGAVQKLDRNSG